jgi:EmrB/QacA subfamily drug resistance transporter
LRCNVVVEHLLANRSSRESLRRQLLREPRRPAVVRASPRAHWYVVGTVCIGAFMGQLDASIVTLALPRLGRELHASVGAAEWVALTYLLVLVASVATVGRLADAVGRKLLYVYGFGVFTAGSVLCGLAPSLAVLIAARVVQAVGAAMLQANSVALITEAVPPRLLARAIGAQGTAQALGLALGPAIGGILLALGGWRLIFLVNLPAGAIGLVLGWFLLPRSRSRRPVGRSDRLGAVLLALAAAGPLLYLSLAGHAGFADPLLLVMLTAGLAAAVGFVRRERRVSEPLVELSILRHRAVSVGLSSGLVSYLALFGTLYVVPYYLSAEHVGAAVVGLQLAVLPVAIGIAAPVGGRLVNRLGARPLTAGGLLLTGVGLVAIALWHGTSGLLAGLALAGLGLGAFTPANNASIMSASPKGYAGMLSGVLNMTRGVGTALGVALASALYIAASGASGAGAPPGAAASGLTLALASLGSIVLAAAVALLLSPATAGAGEQGQNDGAQAAPACTPRDRGVPDRTGERSSCPRLSAVSPQITQSRRSRREHAA